MSEPEERDLLDGGGAVRGTSEEGADESGAALGSGHDLAASDLSDAGVGLSMGEPNTFEPEEAGPDVAGPTE